MKKDRKVMTKIAAGKTQKGATPTDRGELADERRQRSRSASTSPVCRTPPSCAGP